jgi:hypothetical protein
LYDNATAKWADGIILDEFERHVKLPKVDGPAHSSSSSVHAFKYIEFILLLIKDYSGNRLP